MHATGISACAWRPMRRCSNLSCGYVGRVRWLAGSGSARPSDLRIHQRRARHRGADRRGGRSVRRARARVLRAAPLAPSRARAPRWPASFDALRDEFLQDWNDWGSQLQLPRPDAALGDAGLLSAAVLKIHEDRAYPGAVVASLSVPWGNSTDTLGGYHLVWPRDATLTAFALLAANQLHRCAPHPGAPDWRRSSRDGRWPQNYFPSGEPFWIGVQLDEAAFPVLLAAKLRETRRGRAAGHQETWCARRSDSSRAPGPSSPQDRWEENPGVSPFTLAAAISALVAAAPVAERTTSATTRSVWPMTGTSGSRSGAMCATRSWRAGSACKRLLRAHRQPDKRGALAGQAAAAQSRGRDDPGLGAGEHGFLLPGAPGTAQRARPARPGHHQGGRPGRSR